MARHRHQEPAHIEPPSWYRTFDPAAWDQPDGHEQSMIDGWYPMGTPWPDYLHQAHARRRWSQAQYQYRRENPALATQEFLAIVSAERYARSQER